MRYGNPDDSQADIVATARAMGCSVAITTLVGDGFPDLVVGINRSVNLLVEVKSRHEQLRTTQKKFIARWRGGKVHVIRTPDEMRELVDQTRRELWRPT